MKKLATITIIGFVLMTMSCHESETLQKQTKSFYSFDGTEGGAITLEVASQWINNYAVKNPSGPIAHFFGQEVIKKILATDGAVGIRIYYSIDNSNQQHLLLTGTDRNGNDLLATYGVKGIASKTELKSKSAESFRGSEGESVSFDVAKQWVANFTQQNPLGVRAHFFGHEIINQILAEKNCTGIRIYYALNDSGIPQLLLVGARIGGSNIIPASGVNYRETTTDTASIADMSYPCPAFCTSI